MLKMSRKPSKKLAKVVLATLLFTGGAQLAISPSVAEAESFAPASTPTITGTVVKDSSTPVTINSTNCITPAGEGWGAGNRAYVGDDTAFSQTPAEGYNVTITGANSWKVFSGVQLDSVGTIRNNILTINGGSFSDGVVGGQAYGLNGNNLVTQNTVIVNNGTMKSVSGGELLSGYGVIGDAVSNTVYINGGQVKYVYGGITQKGVARGNHVEYSTDSAAYYVTGGFSYNGDAISNEAVIKSGKVTGEGYYSIAVAGGQSFQGNANSNTVVISGGEIGDSSNNVYGGWAVTGNANGNKVTVEGSADIKGNVYGGASVKYANYTVSGDASNNTVTISGGTINKQVFGGNSAAGDANKNTVTISGGTLKNNIMGGYSTDHKADDNTVTISGSPEISSSSSIWGGNARTSASNNTVNILSPITVSLILGGYVANPDGQVTGNTLNVAAKGVTTGAVQGFQNMNFYLPSNIANNDTMLTVNGSEATDVQGVTFGVAALSGVKLVKGDTVNLLVNSNGLNTDDTLKTVESSTLVAPNNLATDSKYELSIEKKDTTTIIAKVDNVKEDPGPSPTPTPAPDYSNNERLKSLVETREAAATMLNAGTDLLTGQGMQNAADAAAERDAGGGFNTFAAVGVSKLRAQSGSHVDTKGIGLNLGFAREIENKSGKLLFGPVLEYGHGSYDSYQDNGIKADGKASYWGIGIIARQTNNNGLYYEGSIRAGRVKSDYDSDLSAVTHASYDSSSTYWAAHAGIGKLMDIGNNNTLDVYGKYFYSHTGSDSVTVHATGGDEEINFRGVNSHRVRAGARFIHAINEKNKIYGGLAYQYEFGGEARAIYNGGSTPSPSVKGSSGLIELGWQVKPGKKSPMTIDLGVTGWVGKQRGITANVQANWTF